MNAAAKCVRDLAYSRRRLISRMMRKLIFGCLLASAALAAEVPLPPRAFPSETRMDIITIIGPTVFSSAGFDKLSEDELKKVLEIMKGSSRHSTAGAGDATLSDSAASYMRTLGFEAVEVLGETTIKNRTYLVYKIDGWKKAVEADRLISRFRPGMYWAKLFGSDLQQMMDRSGSIQYFYGKAIDAGR